jgi:hypothetical protein
MTDANIMLLLGSFAGIGGIPLIRWLTWKLKGWVGVSGAATLVALLLGCVWNLLLVWAGVLTVEVPAAIALGILTGAGASGYDDWKSRAR